MIGFFEQVLAILRNTFLECVRQPVCLVIIAAATLLVLISNPLSAFTMMDDQRMYVDIGLSTVFMSGAILAAFLATAVVHQEVQSRTLLLVVSKPVPRWIFVLGKFLGVTLALLAATALPALFFLLVEVHGVMQTAATPFHLPVLLFGALALVGVVAIATWCNFFYGSSFPAVVCVVGVPLMALAYIGALFFDPSWNSITPSKEFRPELLVALVLMGTSLTVLAAIAIAASTRLGQILTIGVTLGLLLLGLLSDWLFARNITRLKEVLEVRQSANLDWLDWDRALLWLNEVAYAVVPNFQVFWVVDAINQEAAVPTDYLWRVLAYGASLTIAALAVATALFQRREVA
ncbi:MAG: ABC transporter permease subunit [Planctomycetota bacterium]